MSAVIQWASSAASAAVASGASGVAASTTISQTADFAISMSATVTASEGATILNAVAEATCDGAPSCNAAVASAADDCCSALWLDIMIVGRRLQASGDRVVGSVRVIKQSAAGTFSKLTSNATAAKLATSLAATGLNVQASSTTYVALSSAVQLSLPATDDAAQQQNATAAVLEQLQGGGSGSSTGAASLTSSIATALNVSPSEVVTSDNVLVEYASPPPSPPPPSPPPPSPPPPSPRSSMTRRDLLDDWCAAQER